MSWVRLLLSALLGLVLLVLAAVGGLMWRLDHGPLDATGLARWALRKQGIGLALDHVSVQLAHPHGGPALQIDMAGAAQPPQDGQPGGTVEAARVVLAIPPLLLGQIAPREVTAQGVHLQLSRGDMAHGGGGPSPGRLLDSLQHVAVSDLSVDVADAALGQTWQVRQGSAELDRTGPKETLQASAVLGLGDVSSQLTLTASRGPDGVAVEVSSAPVSPAALAGAAPALAPLAALDAPVALRLDATLDRSLALRHAALHATAGPGTVQLPAKGGGTSTGHFASIALDASGTLDALQLQGLQLVLAPPSGNPPTTVVFTGDAARAHGRFTAHVAVDIDHVAMADLAALWPERVGGGSRGWLTENLTAGTAHDGHAHFTLTGAENGDDMDVTDAGGTLTGDDVTLWWLRPVPPIEHLHAVLAWLDPDTILITATGGKQGAVQAKTGTIRITGLAGHDQVGVIAADLAGPLADILAVLRHPRLRLLSKHPLPFASASGTVADQLSVRLPLEAKVTIEQVAIKSHATLADVHIGNVAAGRDLDHGQLVLDVTNDGTQLGGTGQLAHIPSTLGLDMDFRAGPPSEVLQHATVALAVSPPDLAASGLGGLGLTAGTVPIKLDYAERRDGTALLTVGADLTAAAFETPVGWSKAAGRPGEIGAEAQLVGGRLVGLDHITAEAPGLSLRAHSEMVGGHPAIVHVERLELGRTSAAGTIWLPQQAGEAYRVRMAGRQLDLEGQWKSSMRGHAAASHPAAQGQGTPYDVDLRFDRVILAASRPIGPLSLSAVGNGRNIANARLELDGAERTTATMQTAAGERHLNVATANLGALLQATGLATEIVGGQLELHGTIDDRKPNSPFEGTLDIRSFTVRGAPVAGKVLQVLTLYGVLDALRGPGLAFDRLDSPLRLDGSVLTLADARAFSSSLGVTASGQLDFDRQSLDLKGTIVPAYFFNSLPGRIPLLGRLFSPDKGSGLFAADYALQGAISDPSVTINPLSALAPGFTRKFFGLFD